MKLLILGAKGMLGQTLLNRGTYTEQSGTDAELIGWDREELDITDKNQVEEKISRLSPDIIINCAAYNDVDRAEKDERGLAMKVNGEAVGYLAETAARLGAILVHYSTDYVFKGDCRAGYKEDDEPDPQSWYAKSKYEGEKQVTGYPPVGEAGSLQVTGLKYYLIRTSRLFGPPANSGLGKKSFVDAMLDLALNKGRKEFDLVDEEKSCPTYSQDLAKLTRWIFENKLPYGIYHGVNVGACTWFEFGKEIFRLKNLDVKINPVPISRFPRPAARPAYSELRNTKLPKQRSWQEALEEYLIPIKG